MSCDDCLSTAADIGRGLVSNAFWHEGRCSWMGSALDPADQAMPEFRPVGPFLYGGTAGIALFLAQLASATGDGAILRTARGAIRHAIAEALKVDPAQRDGFHGGPLGIAWAAARVARLLDDQEAAAGAAAVAEHTASSNLPPRPSAEVVSGAAGAIAARLGLAALLDDPRHTTAAYGRGEALLTAATVRPRGWSWADPARPRRTHLCGVAHGAAGIGWALLELFAATGDERFVEAATGAFAYERSWVCADTGWWPDLRRPRRHRATRPATVATWCYGEAGIALSRLRATEIVGEGAHCSDADISVRATLRHVEDGLPHAIENLSLCHGVGGAALALQAAGETDAAAAVGEAARERHADLGDWPCGAQGTTPALFPGLSGIGWLFLALHDPSIGSPLALPAAA